MKSPFRFGARKDAATDYTPPPSGEADAWSMLRGPSQGVAPSADWTPTAADAGPDGPNAPPAAPAAPRGEPRRPDLPARVGARKTSAGGAVAYAGANRIETWRNVSTLETLGRPAEPHRLRLHAPVQSPMWAPLFDAGSLPEHITAAHRTRPLAPATEFFAVPGHELGGLGLLQQGGRVWVNDAVQPARLNAAAQADRLAMPDAWTGSLLNPDAEIVETDTPVGVALHPDLGYGNFLLEMLPRLLLLARLRAFGRPLPLAVPSDAPTWLHDFVALLFDPTEIIGYDSRRQRLRAPCFVLPGMMHDDANFHLEMNALVETLLARAVGRTLPSPRPPARLCLSRRHHRGWHGIDNEAEVELALVELGFTVVHPQDHTLLDQLAMYAGAECIAADYGPAAHNALVAPRGAAVVCVDWRDRRQSGIAALRGQPIAFMPPQGGFFDPARPRDPQAKPPRVDCEAFSARVKAFLKFAEAQRGS